MDEKGRKRGGIEVQTGTASTSETGQESQEKKSKFPEREEGRPELRIFLKAAGGSQPKIPQTEMLVPTPDCEANRNTGTEDKKRKFALVCEEDDKLEPSTRRPACKLQRKLSFCSETLELNSNSNYSSSSSIPQYSNLKTTKSRKYVNRLGIVLLGLVWFFDN